VGEGEGEIDGLASIDRIAALANDRGALLIAIGFLGLAFTPRNKEVATNPDSEPPVPRSKMQPLPRLLDSSSSEDKRHG
jgi:hypothetical protein